MVSVLKKIRTGKVNAEILDPYVWDSIFACLPPIRKENLRIFGFSLINRN